MNAADGFQKDDELGRYLAALERDACYRVVRPLGSTSDGGSAGDGTARTELVVFEGANGAALGPFVRKRMPRGEGLGSAYEALFELQQAGRRFRHLPRILDCYRTSDELIVVSEYIEGATLEELVRHDGGGLASACVTFPAVCDAVAELHGLATPPIIHRDVKPANIIVSNTPDGITATLIDFGIARRYREGTGADTVRFGTRAYAPPEQFGFGQTDVRSDVYALGMVLLFCLTGREPTGQPTAETLAAQAIASDIAAIVLKATAFDPAARYAGARELKEAFCAAASAEERDRSHTASRNVQEEVVLPPVNVDEGGIERRAAKGHGGRIPLWAAWCWDALLVLCAVLFVGQAVEGTISPEGNLIGKPQWYNVALNWFIVLPIAWAALFFLLDRRPLARLLPMFAHRTRLQDAKVLGIYLVVVVAVVLFARIVAGF